jgi:hypothetical protein
MLRLFCLLALVAVLLSACGDVVIMGAPYGGTSSSSSYTYSGYGENDLVYCIESSGVCYYETYAECNNYYGSVVSYCSVGNHYGSSSSARSSSSSSYASLVYCIESSGICYYESYSECRSYNGIVVSYCEEYKNYSSSSLARSSSSAARLQTFFDGDEAYWYVENDTYNAWYGSGGSFLISDDYGYSNSYDNTISQVSHLYTLVDFPESNYSAFTLSFDFRGEGEQGYDYLSVALVPNNNSIWAGGKISSSWQVGSEYALAPYWGAKHITLADYKYSGASYYLVFTWQNDSESGDNPPASIKNISITGYY